MTIDFYYLPGSPPCRAIQMTAKAVGVELNLIRVELQKGEHLTDEFIAINPQHNVPTIVDNGFVLNESRAIMGYLVDRYGRPDDPLYPRDPQKRAIVNQRLHFDMGTLYESFSSYYFPVMFGGAAAVEAANYEKIEKALGFFEQFLDGKTYACGEAFTIADISLVASVSSFVHADGVVIGKQQFPNVTRWFNKCKQVTPRYDLNIAGLREFKPYFELIKNKA